MPVKAAGWTANNVDPDQMPHSVASDLGLHYLLRPVCPYAYMHYENTPFQIYWEFYHQKMNFQMKNSGSFHTSAQNIDFG